VSDTSTTTLAVVVLAARGGETLAAALARATWADGRTVLDPARVASALPAAVALIDAPAALEDAVFDWTLVLREDDALAPEAVTRIREAIADPRGARVMRLPVLERTVGVDVMLRRGSARLGARGVPLTLRAGLEVEFDASGPRIDAPIVRGADVVLAEAVERLGAEAGTLAALADAAGGHPRSMLWEPFVAAWRILVARRGSRRPGLARLVVAVLEAYRVVVAYAKLWERRRDRVLELA